MLNEATDQILGLRRLITTWQNMIDRCYNPDSYNYPNYGGRGVKVCDRWRRQDGLINFINDMGIKPSNATIDRIDNDGNYCPENCRWASNGTNQRNKRNNLTVIYYGKSYVLVELCEQKNLDPLGVRLRIKRGWSVERAIDEPGIKDYAAYTALLKRQNEKMKKSNYFGEYKRRKKKPA